MDFRSFKCYLPETLPPQRRSEITYVLECNFGEVVDAIHSATHIVTNSSRFDGWQNVDEDVKVVSVSPIVPPCLPYSPLNCIQDLWVDRCLVLGKALPCVPLVMQTFPSLNFRIRCEFYSADPAKIFSGVVACGSGVSRLASFRV